MTLDIINTRLKDIYGITNDGNPRFRLVKAKEQIVKIQGLFREFVPNTNIFLREFYGVKDIYKYGGSDAEYVLERYVKEPFLDIYPAMDCPEDTPVNHWSGYEPYFIFNSQAVKDNLHLELPPWKAVNFVIYTNLFLERRMRGETESESSLAAQEEKQLIKEKIAAYDFLQNEHPEIPGRLKSGEAVFISDKVKEN